MTDIKLKPCPFCGCGEAGTQWHHGYWSVTCGYEHGGTPSEHCHQDWGEFETEEEAIEAWNRRTESGGRMKTMVNTKLKPCPFCGEEEYIDFYQGVFRDSDYIQCLTCGAEIHSNYNGKYIDAKKLWNRRANLKDGDNDG